LTYDLRGNIITLQRNGLNSNGWTSNHFVAGTYGRIDNLTYAYNTKNQLLSINEASLPTRGFKTNPNATGNQYGYDANGNLIFDKNKYISSIEYNYLNLPIKVVIDNPDAVNSGSIEFIYDATGTKLRKTVKNKDGSVKETWDYVNGVEYKNQILQRVAHSEGAVVRNDLGQYQHEYVLRDHLGNTRVTFTDGVNKGEPYWDWSNYTYMQPDNTGYDDGVVTESDIKQIHHTYPFGMAMEGNWNNIGTAGNNQYLYNGKQWNDDFGMGWYDYGARFYDPSIARWSVVDPMAEARITLSGYQYVQNNPIMLIDPTGMLDAKSMYGGTYGYDSQQASQKGVSGRMDDSDDEAYKNAGARKVKDFEGNSHSITEDDIKESGSIPSFTKLWNNYSDVSHPNPKSFFKTDIYGGKNHCAINLSNALILSGVSLKKFKGARCEGTCPLEGDLKGQHTVRAEQLAEWLKRNPFGLGKPSVYSGQTFEAGIKDRTGIVFFEDYWQRPGEKGDTRTGDHIDLWNKWRLGNNNLLMSWIRSNYPEASENIGMSDLRRSKTVLFWEIK
jgi:RHS repeat-associated protein